MNVQRVVSIVRLVKCAGTALALCAGLPAQSFVDSAYLEKARKAFQNPDETQTLRCEIKPIQPALNFGLRLQTGYKLDIPLNQFQGIGHGWSALLRVTPQVGEPVYLASNSHLPEVPGSQATTAMKADGELFGYFLVGDGTYDVALRIRDDQGRVCRSSWRIDAKLGRVEHGLVAAMPPNTVGQISGPHPATAIDAPKIGRLTVLVHAAPKSSRTSTLVDSDIQLLLDMLESLVEHVPAREVRFALFSLEQQQVLLRKDDFTTASIDNVSDTLNTVQLGKVDLSVLQNRTGAADLLTGLADTELRRENPSDLVVFIGAHSRTDDPIPSSAFQNRPGVPTQFFYLQYLRSHFADHPNALMDRPRLPRGVRRNPGDEVWDLRSGRAPDSIEMLMNRLKGHTIRLTKPQDFADAIARLSQSVVSR